MNESLGDLLHRSVEAVPKPHLDVGELVGRAGRRQRQRWLVVVACTTALVGAIVIGSLALLGGQPRQLEPTQSPSPSVVGRAAAPARPLVYAAGKTVHVGDDTFEAGAKVQFLGVTDDGVVFVTEDSDRWWNSDTLWFNDGSTTEAIGRTTTEHIGYFDVDTPNTGSLVVWAEGKRSLEPADQFVVYDTSRHEVVARVPFRGRWNNVLHVDDGRIYFNPDSGAPGCWVIDIHYCKDPHLLRYDVASGDTRKIARATFKDELRRVPRMLVLTEARGDTGTVFTAGSMARFNQVGNRLVPVDSNGDPTVFRRPTGEPLALRVPAGYTSPGDEMSVVQWIDDDRIVLFANEGGGDLPAQVGDLLVCNLPDGRCRVAVRASSTPYIAPG